MRLHITQRPKSSTQKLYRAIVATDDDREISQAEGDTAQHAATLAVSLVQAQLDALVAEAKKSGLVTER